MIFSLFRRSANETVIDRLYGAVMDASRCPALYVELGIADTFEGRFESLTLHATLVLRRLREAEWPGPDMAQHLVDRVFAHFDRTLREMGVGDTVVPKRMRGLAEAFLGRGTAYEEAMRNGQGALTTALYRNVYGGRRDAEALTRYVEASIRALGLQPLQEFIEGRVLFPAPILFADAAGPYPSVVREAVT